MRWILSLCALWLIGEYVHFVRLRLLEPYALRWLETYLFRSALEASRGGALYPEPSLAYIAPIYQPLYFVFGGALFRLFGESFAALRSLSLLAFSGCILVCYQWLRSVKLHAAEALGFASLLLLIPGALNHWMTTANIDAPFFLCVLIALRVVRFERHSTTTALVAALCMMLAYAFKQQAAPFALALALTLNSRRATFVYIASFAALWLLWTAGWHFSSDGWSTRITLGLPLHASGSQDFSLWDWLALRSPLAAVAFVLGIMGVGLFAHRRVRRFWLLIGLAALLMTWLSGRKAGGTVNNLLPYLVLSFLFLGEAWAVVRGRWPRWSPLVLVVALPLVLEARSLHAVNAELEHGHSVAPGESAYAQIERFELQLEEIRGQLSGPLFIGARARDHFHQTALFEGTVRAHLYHADEILGESLRTRHFEAILLWKRPEETELRELIAEYYELSGVLGTDPLIGLEVEVYEPR